MPEWTWWQWLVVGVGSGWALGLMSLRLWQERRPAPQNPWARRDMREWVERWRPEG